MRWTEESIKILKDNYKRLKDKDICKLINKKFNTNLTVNAIQKKRSKLRYMKNKNIDVSEKKKNIETPFLLNENKKLLKQLDKEKSRTKIILDAIKSSILSLPPIHCTPNNNKIKTSFDSEEMCLLLSDLHIGEKTELVDTSGLSHYNIDEFKKRLSKLISGIELIYSIHSKVYPIPVLNILGLGDYVTGADIYSGQGFYIDQTVINQIFLGAQLLARGIRSLCEVFNKVRLIGVNGNHGKINAKGHFHWKTNFDYIFLKILQILLKDIKNCQIIVAESELCLLEIQKHLMLIAHGDHVRSWMSLPFYGLDRSVRRWITLMRQPIEIVAIGHHHRHCNFDVAYAEAIINGAWTGGSRLSVNKMQEAGTPKQLLFGMHPKQGKTWTYDIKLTEKPDILIPDKNGIYTPSS